MMRPLLLVIAVLLAATRPAPASAANVTTLVRSGDVASDGLAIDTIVQPVAHRATDAAFVGTTSAIVVRQGAATAVLAKTGDALPGGEGGSFNAVHDPAVDDAGGRVAFAASLNGNVAGGVFVSEGGALRRAWSGDVEPAGVGLNAGGDLAFHAGGALLLVAHGTTDGTPIASLADPLLETTVRRGRFGTPAVNDAGAVAFVVDNRRAPGGGVFYWSASTGVVAVGRAGDASPLAGRVYGYTRRQAAAIDASGRVAFTATLDNGDTGVFVWDPGTASAQRIATPGTAVGTATLTNVDPEYVGIDASGRVVFQGRFGSARRLVRADGGAAFTTLGPIASDATDFDTGVTPGGRLAWIRGGNVEGFDGTTHVLLVPGDVPLGGGFVLAGPGISDGGTVVCEASRSALYRVTDGTVRAVVHDGDAVGGIGPVDIASGVETVFRDDALVVLVRDTAGRRLLAVERGGNLVKIVASGDASPLGGTFDPSSATAVDVSRRKVVFSSPLALAPGTSGLFAIRLGAKPVRALVRPGDPVPGGGAFADVALVGGGKPVFRGTLADGRTGLFALRGRRVAVLARSGDAAPSAGTFGEVRAVAVDGDRVAFTALLGPAADGPQGLFGVQRGRVQKIAASGDVPPAGGTFATFTALEIAGDRAVFGATVVEGTESRLGVFRGKPGRIETVILAGDPVDAGATLGLATFDRVAVDGKTIGFVGDRVETTATQSAVFEIARGTVGTVAVSGDPTPLGGAYGTFAEESVARADGALVFAASIDGVADARTGLFAASHDRRR